MIYKDLIAKSFNEPKKSIKENLLLAKFNWDSMTKINLITIIDNRYKKTLDYRKFEKLKTFGDLNKLIIKTLK
jgi:acyl carrier protein